MISHQWWVSVKHITVEIKRENCYSGDHIDNAVRQQADCGWGITQTFCSAFSIWRARPKVRAAFSITNDGQEGVEWEPLSVSVWVAHYLSSELSYVPLVSITFPFVLLFSSLFLGVVNPKGAIKRETKLSAIIEIHPKWNFRQPLS